MEIINEANDTVGYLDCYRGKDSNEYFVRWMGCIRSLEDPKPDEAGIYIQYDFLTDSITVNDQTVDLQHYTYFSLSEEVTTLEIDGIGMGFVEVKQ